MRHHFHVTHPCLYLLLLLLLLLLQKPAAAAIANLTAGKACVCDSASQLHADCAWKLC
jgi:hypothetical protein